MADELEDQNSSPITPELMQQYQDMKNQQSAPPEIDQDVLNQIRNKNVNHTSLKDQLKSAWGFLTAPGFGLTPPPDPNDVPYSSKFGNADEWQAYNNAQRELRNGPSGPATANVDGAKLGAAIGGQEGIPQDPDLNNAAKMGALAGVNAYGDPSVDLTGEDEDTPRAIASAGKGKNPLDPDMSNAKKLASLNPVSMGGAPDDSKTINIGNDSLGSRDKLAMAQKLASQGELTARLGAAANLFGSGLSRSKAEGQELFAQNAKDAQGIVTNYKDAVANEKEDPNSPASRGFKDYMEKLTGYKLNGNISAADAEKLYPMMFKGYESEQARIASQQNLQFKMKELAQMKSQHDQYMGQHQKEQKDAKDEAQANKDFAAANKLVNEEVASSRSVFGRNANIVRASNAIEQIVGKTPLDQLSQVQQQELATSLDAMLKNGTGTVAGQKGLVPESWIGDLKKFGSKALNRPLGMDQSEFAKNLLEVVANEKTVAQKAVAANQDKLLRGYSHLKEKYPQRWDETFGDLGLSSSNPQVTQDQQPQDQMVPVRRSADGVTKMMPQSQAKKYLAMPGFESGGM